MVMRFHLRSGLVIILSHHAQRHHQVKKDEWGIILQKNCPGFGQDGVNFHQKPGGDTARQADPNYSNKTGYSIPCAVMLGSRWGSGPGGRQSWLGSALGTGW